MTDLAVIIVRAIEQVLNTDWGYRGAWPCWRSDMGEPSFDLLGLGGPFEAAMRRRSTLRVWMAIAGTIHSRFTNLFIGMGTSPVAATPAFDHWFAGWFRAYFFTSVATLIVGLLGLGKRQWVVVLSAFITPLSCVLQKVLE